MTDVLVVPDRSFDGAVEPSVAELIGAASAIGTPVVLAADRAQAEELGALGAAVVLVSDAPLIDAAAAAFDALYPAAVLFAHTVRGLSLIHI